jgi:hypothetical protein
LLLPEGQTGEASELSKKQCSFVNRDHWTDKYFHLVFKKLMRRFTWALKFFISTMKYVD